MRQSNATSEHDRLLFIPCGGYHRRDRVFAQNCRQILRKLLLLWSCRVQTTLLSCGAELVRTEFSISPQGDNTGDSLVCQNSSSGAEIERINVSTLAQVSPKPYRTIVQRSAYNRPSSSICGNWIIDSAQALDVAAGVSVVHGVFNVNSERGSLRPLENHENLYNMHTTGIMRSWC